jgi:MoxR-like ATPase
VKLVDCWTLVEKVLPYSERLLLYGVPGTGKSRLAQGHGLKRDEQIFSVTLTEETPAAEIRGHWIPKGETYEFHDGAGIAAWRKGTRLVINEIDHASGDLMSILLAILDDPEIAMITLPSGETVRPTKGFRAIATMNGKPEDLPEALRDRFPVRVDCDKVHPGAIARLPKDLQKPAAGTVAIPDSRGKSVRGWLAFAALRDSVGEELALQAVFQEDANEVGKALKLNRK